PLDTILPTPGGWRRLAEVHPGDQLFGRDGQPTVVLAESAVEVVEGWTLELDDGSTITAHDDHRWLTFDAVERAALTRRDPEWRARRRANRSSRATGKRSARFTEAITARNQASPPPSVPPPKGTIRTTAEMAAALRLPSGRRNYALPVTEALCTPRAVLPIDPYVLGVWLGDGTTKSGVVTTMDGEIVAALEDAGWPVTHVQPREGSRASAYRFAGLTAALRRLGVLGGKRVPDTYLWADQEQRLALLQGLMDTDGGVENKSVAFTSTRQVLTEAVAFLARSLGHKVQVREGRATLNGQDHGPVWRVKFAAHVSVFRLPRKRDAQKITVNPRARFRYVAAARRVGSTPMKCLRVAAADGLFLAGRAMIPTHNSDALLMAALQYVDVGGYSALILRRTFAELAISSALM